MTICKKEEMSSMIESVALEAWHPIFEISNKFDLVLLVCSILKKVCASLVRYGAADNYPVLRNFIIDYSEKWQGKEEDASAEALEGRLANLLANPTPTTGRIGKAME